MFKNFGKRMTGLVMATVLLTTTVLSDYVVKETFAEQDNVPAESLDVNGVELLFDGQNAYISDASSGGISVTYGDTVALSLEKVTSEDTFEITSSAFSYYQGDTATAENLHVISDPDAFQVLLDEGFYKLNYEYNFNVRSTPGFTEAAENKLYGFTVVKAKLDTPVVTWDGKVASFTEVTKGNGIATTPASYYLVPKKDGAAIEGAAVTLSPDEARTYDFTNLIAANGFGVYTLEVTAKAAADSKTFADSDTGVSGAYTETEAPVIENYNIDSATGRITANVKDDGIGVYSYAFTTGTPAASDWKVLDFSAPGTAIPLSFDAGKDGDYTLYVKDYQGNQSSTSDEQKIHSHEIKFENYYSDSTPASYSLFLLERGEEKQTLSIDGITSPVRVGYALEGWYATSDFSGEKVTELTTATGTLYANWIRADLAVTVDVTGNPEKTYDGQEVTLKASTNSNGAQVAWQWYKDGEAIEGAVSDTLTVKNVSDSGTYKAEVSAVIEGVTVKNAAEKTVSITAAYLQVRAENKSVGFEDAVPEYTYVITGFVNNETAETAAIVPGTLSCDYTPGGSVKEGGYVITPSGFSAPNYTFSYENGTLTVGTKDISGEVTVEMAQSTSVKSGFDHAYVYTGSAITPVTAVKRGDAALTEGTDYQVSYTDNVNTGDKTAEITFIGNYKGTKNVTFCITKAAFTPEVQVSDWTYGDTEAYAQNSPRIKSNVSGGDVSYYFLKQNANGTYPAESEAFTYIGPSSDAGTYKVWLKVAETENYEAAVSEAKEFEIKKRVITITANSNTWVYDGNPHTDSGYTVEGTFASEQEGFQYVIVEGSVLNVGDGSATENKITHVAFTSSTDEDNYEIVKVSGELKVTPVALPVPTNPQWSAEYPGTATWVSITRENLSVNYEVKLYAVGTGDAGADDLVDSVTLESVNTWDVKDKLKAYTEKEGKACTFYYTVKVIPASGTAKNNYLESAVLSSKTTATIKTVKITAGQNEANGVSSVTVDDAETAWLLEGETATVEATALTGYSFDPDTMGTDQNGDPKPVWKASGNVQVQISDAYASKATITVPTGITGDASGYITAYAEDEMPVILDFKVGFKDNDNTGTKGLEFTVKAEDTRGIAGYAIDKKETADENTVYTSYTPDEENEETALSLDKSVSCTAAGTYYLHVKDGSGNVVTYSKSVSVYTVSFSKGAEDAAGTMATLLKPQDASLVLPENAFTRANYSFIEFTNAEGIAFLPQGNYTLNANAVLTAQWSNKSASYTVVSHYMDTDGTYSDKEGLKTEKHYNGYAGAVIKASDAVYQSPTTGLTRDENNNGVTATLTLSEDDEDQALHIYYKREKHTVTYKYTDPETNETKTLKSNDYYYGQAVAAEPGAPDKAENVTFASLGYSFNGWDYGDAGMLPETMPLHDINVTGSFSPVQTVYTFVIYEHNLGKNTGYTLDSALGFDMTATHGDTVDYDTVLSEIRTIEGFTLKGFKFSYGNPSGASEQTGFAGQADTGTVKYFDSEASSQPTRLYVSCYYERNSYSLKLEVYKSPRAEGNSNLLFAPDPVTLEYGAAVPADFAEKDGYYTWVLDPEKDLDGYVLAQYVDWSTGAKPFAMPAADVTVNREYVNDAEDLFDVVIYYEEIDAETGATTGWTEKTTIQFYAPIGSKVTISGDGDTSTTHVNYTQFNYVEYFEYYEFDAEKTGWTENEGKVLKAGSDGYPLTFEVYFKRKVYKATIKYYEKTKGVDKLKYTREVYGKWGSKYDIQATLYFGAVDNEDTEEYIDKGYIISYTAYYWAQRSGHWETKKFVRAEHLTENYRYYFGQNDSSYTNVYYSLPDESYNVEIQYRTNNLKGLQSGDADYQKDYPLYVEDEEGKQYKIKVANKTDVLEYTKQGIYSEEVMNAQISAYPGLANYLATDGLYTFSYGDTPTANTAKGFTGATITSGGTTLYINSDSYAYVPLTSNALYYGAYASFNYLDTSWNPGKAGYSLDEAFLAAYKANETYTARDKTAQYAYIYNGGFSAVKTDTAQAYFRFTFDYTDAKNVVYLIPGLNSCTHEETAAVGTTYYGTEHAKDTCPHQSEFVDRHGFEIKWYMDSAFTIPVGQNSLNEGIKVTSSTGTIYIYGRYEKLKIQNKASVSFQLPDPIETEDGEVSYITADNIDTYKDIDKMVKTVDDNDGAGWTYTDDFGVERTVSSVTSYTYDGELCYAELLLPVESYTDVSFSYNDYVEIFGESAGFSFDISNTMNVVEGYTEYAAITLYSYISRNQHTLTTNENTPTSNDVETITVYEESIELEAPTRGGYSFTGWTVKKAVKDAETGVVTLSDWADAGTAITVDESDNSASFDMPDMDLYATANWTAANYTQTITHYYTNSLGGYDMDLLSEILSGTADEASYTVDSHIDAETGLGYVCYYRAAEKVPKNLIARVDKVTLLNEKEYTIDELVHTYTGFNFTNAVLNATAITILKAGDTFDAVYASSLDLFYSPGDCTITVTVKATDDGDASCNVTGAGYHYFNEEITLSATPYDGYSIVGWYLEDENNDNDILDEEGKVNENYLTLEKAYQGADYTFNVSEKAHYVILLKPADPATPTISVHGVDTYPYGYEDSPANTLNAVANLTDTQLQSNEAYSYTWYLLDPSDNTYKVMEGETHAALKFPAGKTVGSYSVKCGVRIKNTENGRISDEILSDAFTVTVTSIDMGLSIEGYDEQYDGAAHGISVKETALSPEDLSYEVYYSTTEELTAENYSTAGTKTLPTWTDVTLDSEGNPVSHTVYYYIHETGGNYKDVSGASAVTIRRKELNILAKSEPYHKVYDGTKSITGTNYTNLIDSLNTTFEVIGMASSDKLGKDEAYLVDFTAEFNDANVNNAKSVILKNVKIVANNENKTENYNYIFPENIDYVISGYITPCSVEIRWTTNEDEKKAFEDEKTEAEISALATAELRKTTSADADIYPMGNSWADYEDTPVYIYIYNGADQGLIPVIENRSELPGGEKLSLKASDVFTNTGVYNAHAEIASSEEYETSNYAVSEEDSVQPFVIVKRLTKVTPVDDTLTYDGKSHTLSVDSDSFAPALPSGFTVHSVTFDKSEKDAGTYPVKVSDMVIYNAENKDIMDNMCMDYSTAGTLTINKRLVTVSGITAKDKVYDGDADADLILTNAVFKNVVEGETLTLTEGSVTGKFMNGEKTAEDAHVGEDKPVKLTYGASPLTAGKDTKVSNYTLDLEDHVSGDTTQKYAEADITKELVTVTVKSLVKTYGDDDTFEVSYAGVPEGFTVAGNVTFTVEEGDEYVAFTNYISAGTHDVKPDLSGLSLVDEENAASGDYKFVLKDTDENGTPDIVTLKVNPRKVTVEGITAENKVYDNSTKATLVFTGVTLKNTVNNDDVSLNTAKVTGTFDTKNVGTGKTVTLSYGSPELSGAKAGNYTLDLTDHETGDTTQKSTTADITKRPVTVTVDNKTIKYGDAAPEYKAQHLSGDAGSFATGESLTTLGLTFTCGYDTSDAAKRGVGYYDITASSANTNYEVTVNKGTLTVEKAVITVTASGAAITYGDATPASSDLKFSVTGFKYSDAADYEEALKKASSVSAKETASYMRTLSDNSKIYKAGTYEGELSMSCGFSLDNYTIKTVDGTLTVNKKEVKISGGITAANKVYDGNTVASLDISGTTLSGLLGDDKDKVILQGSETTKDDNSLKDTEEPIVTGAFDTKDVGTDKAVSLSFRSDAREKALRDAPGVTAEDSVKDNYYFGGAGSFDIKANITPAVLKVTADDKEVKYGTAKRELPAFTSQITGFVGGETAENAVTGSPVYADVSYTAASQINETFDIIPSAGEGDNALTAVNGNYTFTFVKGTLKVVSDKFPTPAPVWDSETPGTVNWAKIQNISNEAVDHYEVKLFKGSEQIGDTVTVSQCDAPSYDFKETIRKNGAGVYHVTVQAIRGTTGVENVKSSDVGTSGDIYAAKVQAVFAADTDTQAGKGNSDPTVNSAASYVMLGGESATISAALKNNTGYTVKEASSSEKLTVSGGSVTPAGSTVTAGTYTGTVMMDKSLSSSEDITVTLSLLPRAATVDGELSLSTGTAAIPYGYKDVKISASAWPADGDNIEKASYTYTYEWSYKPSKTKTETISGDGTEVTFPEGKVVHTYPVYCLVTATRTDNGKSTTKTLEIDVPVTPKELNITMDSLTWHYGEAHPESYGTVNGNDGNADLTFFYNSTDSREGAAAGLPTDAGTWYIFADAAATDNYKAFTAENAQATYTIYAAKLSTPENFTLKGSSAGKPYGILKWGAVTTFTCSAHEGDGESLTKYGNLKENAVTSNPVSSVSVTYHVILKRGDKELYNKTISATSVDLSAYFSEEGTYTATVQAIATNSGSAQNAADSSLASDTLDISLHIENGNVTRVYDGSTTVLKTSATEAGVNPASFSWKKGEEEVGTSETCSVTFVSDSGTYTCICKDSSDNVLYSTIIEVSITKRPLTFTANTKSKVFDGTALVDQGYTTNDSDEDHTGIPKSNSTEKVKSYENVSTITNVGSVDNVMSAVSMEHTEGGKTTDSTENYTISYEKGKLTVTAKSLGDGASYNTGISVEDIAAVTYDGSAKTPNVVVKDVYANNTTVTLKEGTDYTVAYEANTAAGTATVKITGIGNYKDTITKTFTINKRVITLTGETATKEYTGKEQELTTITVGGTDGLASGQVYEAEYSAKGTEASDTAYPGTITASDKVKIYVDKEKKVDVTSNYTITTTAGALTITKTGKNFSISLADDTYTYDASAHHNTKTPSAVKSGTEALTGVVSYTYSFEKEGTYTDDLSALEKTDAGTYTIYVKATNPNFTGTMETTAKLVINKRKVKFTGESGTVTYDGKSHDLTAVTPGGYEGNTASGLVSGHTHNVICSAKGTEAGSYTGTITKAADVKIYADAEKTVDVTGNYEIETAAGKLTVNKKSGAFKISLEGATFTYDGEAHYDENTAENGAVTAGTAAADLGALTGKNTYTYSFTEGSGYVSDIKSLKKTQAGTYTIYVKATNPNYEGTATATAELVINKRAITITGGSAEKTYTGALQKVETTSVTAGSLAEGDSYTVTYKAEGTEASDNSYKGSFTSVVVIKNAQNQDVTASYTITTVEGTLKINKTDEEFKISLADDAHTYDGTAKYITKTVVNDPSDGGAKTGATTYSYSFTKADEASYVTSLSSLTRKTVGSDTVYVKATNPNYSNAATCEATLTVNQRKVTFTGETLGEKVYTGETFESSKVEISEDGLVSGHTSNVTYTLSGKNVGTYTGTITEKESVVIYDGDGEGKSAVTGNYEITTSAGTLKVTPATLTNVTAKQKGTLTYNGTAQQAEVEKTATAVNAEENPVTFKYATEENGAYSEEVPSFTDAGTYTVWYQAFASNHYDSGKQSFTVTIEKKTVSVTWADENTGAAKDSFTYEYDKEEHGISVILGGIEPCDEGKVSLVTSGDLKKTNANAGSETYSASVTGLSGNRSSNYKLPAAGLTKTWTITPKPIDASDILASAIAAVTYKGAAYTESDSAVLPALTYGDYTLVKGESEDYTLSYANNVNAGTAVITVTGHGNYKDTRKVTFTINKRPVTFTGNSTEVTYDGTEKSVTGFTVSAGSLVTGHVSNVTSVKTATEAGTYDTEMTEKASVRIWSDDTKSDEKDVTANYDITVVKGELKIEKTETPFTVTLSGAEYVYDGTAKGITASPSDTAKTGTTAFSYSFEENGTYVSDLQTLTKTDVGTYTVYVKAENPNYKNAASTTATLKITKKAVSFKGNTAEFTYDGSKKTVTGVEAAGLLSGHTHNVTYSAEGTDAGTYEGTITVASDVRIYEGVGENRKDVTANYSFTDESLVKGSLTVKRCAVTVTAKSPSKTYGDADPELTYEAPSYAVTMADGKAALNITLTRASGIDVGEYVITAEKTKLDADNPNYDITLTDGKLTIKKRPITVTGASDTKTYNGEEQRITDTEVSVGSLAYKDTYECAYIAKGTEASVSPYGGVFTEHVVIKDENDRNVTSNYDVTEEAGKLTIAKEDAAGFTVTLSGSTFLYDGNEKHIENTVVNDPSKGGAKTGVTTYTYSFDPEMTDPASDLSELKKTDAGDYTIYVKAENPNYEKAATATATLTITKRKVSFTGESLTKIYTGETFTSDVYSIGGDGLAEGQVTNVTYSLEGRDASDTAYNGSFTALKDIRIYGSSA